MAKKKGSKAVAAPSGLGISRNGANFTFTWKLGDKKYTAQQLQYRTYNRKWSGWSTVSVGKATTSATVKINLNSSFTWIGFRVRGKKSKSYSKWTAYAHQVYVPPVPSGSTTLDSEFKSTFNWSTSTDNSTWSIYTGFVWESVLAKDYNSSNGASAFSQVADKGSGGATSGSIAREESGWALPEYSYTRWVRVRSKGPAGMSDWRYIYHTYARSRMTTNVKASFQEKTSGGYTVMVNWTTNSSFSHPIEKTVVQYLIGTPVVTVIEEGDTKVSTISCPTSGGSWQSINTLGNRAGARAISFPVSQEIGENKAIFARVNTTHDADSSTVEGNAVLVDGSFLSLSKPTGLQITESDPATHKYTVSANDSTNIPGAFIEIFYRTSSNQEANQVVGIIPSGSNSTTCILPELEEGETMDIGVRSCIGNYSPINASLTDVTYYIVEPFVESDIEWDGGSVPLPPTNVNAAQASSSSIQVTWDWSWPGATSAELSWADHEDAWESTNAPSTFTVNTVHASKWIISGLAVGTWYVRIRLIRTVGDSTTYGTYSDIQTVKLSSSPDTPHLMLSDSVVPETGRFTCYWAYVSNDGTGQLQADVAEAFIDEEDGTITYSNPLDHTSSSQHLTLNVSDLGWHAGETHYLVVRVTSLSGETSVGWSSPIPITIANKVSAEIVETSLVDISTTMENDQGETFTVVEHTLTKLPFTARATGAGVGGITRYIIERNGAYHVERPDESEFEGFDQETIVIKTLPENDDQSAEAECTITADDLIGILDDGARYRLIAEVKDVYGQSAQSEPINFVVGWEHQAVEPTALVEIDKDSNVAFITPQMPESGYEEGDTCDIYRLSADLPELIVKDAKFGTKYVDPYPTLGQFGGHRIVYRTKYGDYITAENSFAWTDYTADDPEYRLDLFGIVIDFDGDQLILPYDVSVDNSWSKDFIETKYLGGTVRGDWNPGVSKSASLSTNVAIQYNPENIESIRRLAVYPGACHVRTPDGSSYTANVDVKENREERKINAIAKISLDITKISSEGTDGMTYAEWIREDE